MKAAYAQPSQGQLFHRSLADFIPNGKFCVSKSRTPMAISDVRGHLTADCKQGMDACTDRK